ncbi:plasmodesmata-located protein 2-like [Cornus florida]|uniref:plasmodesmata-located protein 2-like n=1 Tax=Cornus florida TaxID=4283 RepID=UPI00289BF46C|nr:plasmodesmata-located protein 2-like [Cornus florida]
MASHPKVQCYLQCFTLIFFLCFGLILPSPNTILDYNNLVYKNCVNQTHTDQSNPPPELLSNLFQELIAQSSKSKFFETYIGDDNAAISGLFQCREDLSNGDCNNCVTKLPELSNTLCGDTIPARVQLSGCYVHYEVDGSESSGLELLHKTCSESKAVSSGFEELREGAFAALESGVMSGHGFCDMSYESMRVMAQCGGSLGDCECGECVSYAARIALDECGYSLSGQVYLGNCFISYSYYRNGMPSDSYKENGTGNTSGRLVAIVVGGAAALFFVLLFFYFIRSCGKKKDDW